MAHWLRVEEAAGDALLEQLADLVGRQLARDVEDAKPAAQPSGGGGYQISEYTTQEYTPAEYKSEYD